LLLAECQEAKERLQLIQQRISFVRLLILCHQDTVSNNIKKSGLAQEGEQQSRMDQLPELRDHVELLDKRIHVASRAHVAQTHIANR
jgi:hypothetical protein